MKTYEVPMCHHDEVRNPGPDGRLTHKMATVCAVDAEDAQRLAAYLHPEYRAMEPVEVDDREGIHAEITITLTRNGDNGSVKPKRAGYVSNEIANQVRDFLLFLIGKDQK